MLTVNELLRDSVIHHEINLAHYGNDVVRRMLEILARTDAELFQQLTAALLNVDSTTFKVERLDALLASVRAVNERAYLALREGLEAEARTMTEYEAEFQTSMFRETLPVGVNIASVNPPAVFAAATAEPFRGRLMKEWAEKLAADRIDRIRDNVRIGFVQGRTTQDIVRSVVGTRAEKYADGLLTIDRNNAATVVRTALSHYAAAARDDFHAQNADLIASVVWSSTLDNRTSPMCQIRDGKRYRNDDTHTPIGHKVPWLEGPGKLHWNCRSSYYAVVKGWKALGLDLPAGERSAMDGYVPGDVKFGEWFTAQTPKRQREIFGAKRYELMKRGGLAFDRFFNDKGLFLTLDQLRKRDASAFRRAGI